jgi:hypothetical protein
MTEQPQESTNVNLEDNAAKEQAEEPRNPSAPAPGTELGANEDDNDEQATDQGGNVANQPSSGTGESAQQAGQGTTTEGGGAGGGVSGN